MDGAEGYSRHIMMFFTIFGFWGLVVLVRVRRFRIFWDSSGMCRLGGRLVWASVGVLKICGNDSLLWIEDLRGIRVSRT